MIPTLRPYQVAAVESVRNEMRAGFKRVILKSPTGSGKTLTACEIIRGAQSKGKRIAFLANRIHLVSQTARVLSSYDINCGVIQGENTYEPWRSVLVCSIQTIARRGMPDVDLLIIDECHAAAGTKAYRDVMKNLPVIGLSATPYSQGLGKVYESLGGPLFERVVTAANIHDLIEQGFLVDAEVWAPGEPDLSKVSVVAGDYNEKQLGEAVDKVELVGDIVSHWVRLANGCSTVVFATNISHSKHICEQFRAIGVKAEHLDCYTPDEERVAILKRVATEETTVICNVGVLAEGWDFPACKCLILARPTKSLVRYLQMAGRVLRPFPNKPQALILDHSGVVRRLGFPWDNFDQPLDDGKPKKSGAREKKAEPLPKPCPFCQYVKPPRTPICPKCGKEAVRPHGVGIVDEDLVQLTGKKHRPKVVALAEFGKQEIYSQLLDYALRHSYSSGWVAHKYKEIFGVWPRSMEESSKPTGLDVSNWIRSQNIKFHKSRGIA
ncbi:MAG: DEAD/DEAH box helicase [Acidobacteriota bacterium]|nr:DEAD/DEAH box helicase [Acidobacteriota bacterium]